MLFRLHGSALAHALDTGRVYDTATRRWIRITLPRDIIRRIVQMMVNEQEEDLGEGYYSEG